MTLLSCFFLLVALATAIWLRFSFTPSPLELGPGAAPSGREALVSLVVPMRNEERNVDLCLGSIRAQTYPYLQVIVVDDGSTDGTPAALARWKTQWPELQILRLDDRPPGWAGKTYPAHRGAEAGRGEWLLFLDADVELAPEAVSRAVAAAESLDWPVVSVLGRLKIGSFWEAVLQLYMWALFVTVRVELPRSSLVGAFLLIRRSVYREVGGHAAFPGALSGDVALADLLASRGLEPRVRLCSEAYACRMYSSLREIWQGCSRMLAGGTGFRGGVIAAYGLLILMLDVTPLATLLWLVFTRTAFGERDWMLAGAAGFVLLIRWLAYQRILARMGAPGWAFLTKPLSDLAAVLLVAHAALRSAAGHVTWKGHRYSKASIQQRGICATAVEGSAASSVPSITVIAVASKPSGSVSGDVIRMAEGNADAEFLIASASTALAIPSLPNLRRVSAAAAESYSLRRQALQEARGEVVAFADAGCFYSDGWLAALREDFSDPRTQIVAGRTAYAGEGALAKAGSIRDWGNMEDQQARMLHLPENNFAARRALLTRYDFGNGFRDWGGTLALATLAAADGVEIHYDPRMVCRAPNPYSIWGSAWDRLAARHALLAELVRRDLRTLDFRPLTVRLLERFLPGLVWFSTALAAARAYRPARAALGIRGAQRLAVPIALGLLADLDWLLAQWATLRPSWLSRKGQALGCALSAAVDANPTHPLRRRVSQITWALATDLRTPLPPRLQESHKPEPLAASTPS